MGKLFPSKKQIRTVSRVFRNHSENYSFSWPIFTLLAIVTLSLTISSCSIIEISTKDEVKTYRKLGIINSVSIPNSGAYVDLSYAGLGIANNDFILGYKKSKEIILPNDACTVFIDEKSEINSQVINYLKDVKCTFIYLQGDKNDE